MRQPGIRRVVLLLVAATLCLRVVGDVGVHAAAVVVAFSSAMPRTVVWAWEEPEDLSTIDTRRVGVAYLAETLLLGGAADGIRVLPRHQPLTVSPDAAVMAVVRMQTLQGFRDTPELRHQTASLLAELSHRKDLSALQVDFDATRSQRTFYAAVLEELRPQMPRGLPLSITALASWCAADPTFGEQQDWLSTLPIDEAVPMMFRLGGHSKPNDSKDGMAIREPLCRGSVGLSTDESWPSTGEATAQRIYLFSPHPWTAAQLQATARLPTGLRPAALRVGSDVNRPGINDTGLHRFNSSPASASNSEDQP
jgi:hypothetical protein